MAASNYVYYADVIYNCEFQLGQLTLLLPLQAILTAYRVANPEFNSLLLTEGDILNQLKALTGCTVGTGIDANCYPRGEAEFSCFDLEGNPIP
jgi:hypothetical protein